MKEGRHHKGSRHHKEFLEELMSRTGYAKTREGAVHTAPMKEGAARRVCFHKLHQQEDGRKAAAMKEVLKEPKDC